jgi:hypothetical protein
MKYTNLHSDVFESVTEEWREYSESYTLEKKK